MTEVPTDGSLEKKTDVQKKQTDKAKSKKFFRFGCLPFIIFFVIFFILAQFTKEIEVQVVDKKWERSIDFEKRIQVEQEGWDVPSDAQKIAEFKAVHHYDKKSKGYVTKTRNVKVKVGEKQYVCGQKDLGNGYFEDIYCYEDVFETRQEKYQEEVFEKIPVYKTKYKYLVW